MKCKHCNSEIDDDSLFCENCGAKVEKKHIWKWWIIGVVAAAGLVIGILAIVNYNRWAEIEDSVGSWPPCKSGEGAYYIVQKGYDHSLIHVERGFPIRIKFVDVVVNGKIFVCGGDHSGLGAFALLENDGRVTFVTDYDSGGNLFDNGFSRIGGAMVWHSDINHIYGVGSDRVCGDNCENVNMIFPGGYGQPVQESNGKWRYINVDGNYVFEDEFDDAYPFCYGKARVCKDGRWYYIGGDKHELTVYDGDGRVYEVLQGENFHYNDDLKKIVAEMHLGGNSRSTRGYCGKDFSTLVDGEGHVLDKESGSVVQDPMLVKNM